MVQLYINDPVASITQPVRRLRGFQRVTLDPGQKRTVTFTLDRSDFGFYDNRGRFVVEPGGSTSTRATAPAADVTQSFTVTGCKKGSQSSLSVLPRPSQGAAARW